MNLKRKSMIMAGLLVALSLLLSACGGQNGSGGKSGNAEQGKQAGKSYNLSLSLGGTTGSYYRHGSALADYINQHSEVIRVVPATSGGGAENVRRVGRNEASIGIGFVPDLMNAWNGTGGFEKLQDLRFLGVGEKPIGLQLVVLKRSGITTLDQLKGKRFVLGAPGSTGRSMAEAIMKEKGLLDQIQNVNYGHEELPDKLKDGDIVGFGVLANVPVSRVSEIAATDPVNIIDLGKDMAETNLLQKYPYYDEYPIKANSYPGLETDVMSFGMPSVWFANKNVPEEAVYEFMRQAYSEGAIKALDTAYRDHDHASPDPLKDMVIPLHPGAEKYWKEKGVSIPEPALR